MWEDSSAQLERESARDYTWKSRSGVVSEAPAELDRSPFFCPAPWAFPGQMCRRWVKLNTCSLPCGQVQRARGKSVSAGTEKFYIRGNMKRTGSEEKPPKNVFACTPFL